MTDEPLVTLRQAAALVGRPVGTVSSWAANGKLSVARWRRAVRLFRPSEVRAVAAQMGESPQGRNNRGGSSPEPTADELERLIAERMACLPGWWWKDCAMMNGEAFAAERRAEYEQARRDAA